MEKYMKEARANEVARRKERGCMGDQRTFGIADTPHGILAVSYTKAFRKGWSGLHWREEWCLAGKRIPKAALVKLSA